MRFYFCSIPLLICLIVPFSCKQKDIEPNYKMASVLYKLDISNAEVLALLPSYTYGYYGSNVLYKVTTDGVLEEVSNLNIHNEKLTTFFYPSYFGITDHYLITTGPYSEISLISKSSGTVYRIDATSISMPSFPTYNGQIRAVTDASGNIYFLGLGNGIQSVYKISTAPSAFMKISQYSPVGENVTDFEVDSRGNMLYISSPDYYTMNYRILKKDGGVSDINPFIGMTLGKDDNFYVSQSSGYSTIEIIKITIDNSFAVTTTYLGNYQSDFTMFDTDYKAYNGNKTIFAYEDKISQLNPDNGALTNFTSPATSVSDISYSSTDLYLVGYDYNYYNNTVYKISNSNFYSFSYPLPVSDYYVKDIAASNNGNLLVIATRNSDLKNVLLRVDNGGNVSVLKEDIDPYSASLWKID